MLRLFLGEGFVTSDGKIWRRQRRLVQPTSLRRQVEGLDGTVTAATAEMLDGWSRHAAR